MKKRFTLLMAMLLMAIVGFAQRTPTHPLDIKDCDFNNLITTFQNWTPGNPPDSVSAIDDQFYISRQRVVPRLSKDDDYQIVQGVDPDRNFLLWTPLDDPTSTWKALPRYCFEGDNFSLWSYINCHGNWTGPWFRVTAGLSDVAHKNGVLVGCLLSIPYAASVNTSSTSIYSQIFNLLSTQSNGEYTYMDKFVHMLKYYGIDAIGVNSEFMSNYNSMRRYLAFFEAAHAAAEKIGWHFKLIWYDGTNARGNISFDQGLNTNNKAVFGDSTGIVTDMMFANYNWTNSVLSQSVSNARSWGRSSYDYYAGFDIQGRALKSDGYAEDWSYLDNNAVSIGFWGAHSQSLIHQSSTDNGTSDVAIQQTYLDKQELIFSGGNRNPMNRPALNTGCDLSNASLKNFHGIARYISAKSVIQTVPFVSRFNLGNGLKFRNEGQVTFDHKWHNLNTQDIMPTWRWWIVDGNESATSGNLVKADLTWDDAYFGGSCLQLSGATTLSRVKLFKTAIVAKPDYTISVTYKSDNDLKTHAKLFVALKGALTTYKEVELPDVDKYDAWKTATFKLSDLDIAEGDKISLIGITVEGTEDQYKLLVGELAVRDPQTTLNPVKPTVKTVQVLRTKGSTIDFKMQYASKEESDTVKYYNDEVGTWYYEIWMQEEGQEAQLLTATTSWAAYVIDAPLKGLTPNRQVRFGVQAVAPDGTTKSGISWTDYQTTTYDTPSSEVVVTPEVIKAGDQFTVGLEDALASAAQSWTLTNSETGATVYSGSNSKSFTTALQDEGSYDLTIVDADGQSTTYRGKVHVTQAATGGSPLIYNLTANKDTVDVNEEVTYDYSYRMGEGNASHGLKIADPKRLMIPADVQKGKTYTYALWVKVDSYAHDKQGTNLISKNSVHDSWPHNNWGDLWVQIRPAMASTCTSDGNASGPAHAANEVSFNTFGWTTHDTPCTYTMSTGYSLNPGTWCHIAVAEDNNHQLIYFNGRKVADYNMPASSNGRRDDRSGTAWANDSRIKTAYPADIFIGGGGVYKAGLNATIDEVQIWNKALSADEVKEAMNGYKYGNIPDGLQAYYTFETLNADSTFTNYGKAGTAYPAKVVVQNGSGGESTANADYEKVAADNTVTGYPGVVGTMAIKTTKTLSTVGARVVSSQENVADNSVQAPRRAVVRKALDLGSTANVLRSNFSPAQASWSDNASIDWDNQVVYVKANLSNCDYLDNILSVGANIGNWTGNHLHFYYPNSYYGSTLTCNYVNGTNNNKTLAVSDASSVELIISKAEGVTFNGTTLFSPSEISALYTLSNISIGSQEGSNRSGATYEEISIRNLGPARPDAPTISPEGGIYTAAQTITLAGPEGSTIYYTTDGTEPTTSSTEYTAPFTIDKTCSVKAIAKVGDLTSNVAVANYVIEAGASEDNYGIVRLKGNSVVTYSTPGTYDAVLTLTNQWGETTQTSNTVIVRDPTATGIDGIKTDAEGKVGVELYPNPFVDNVNLEFAESGVYTIDIVTTSGAVAQRDLVKAGVGQVVNLRVSGPAGLYLVQVKKDGRTYKTVKVIKK